MLAPVSSRRSSLSVIFASVALATVLCGCAKESRFVAVEPNADADLRVVIATASTGQKAVAALGRDQPFDFALKDVFAVEGATFRVYVYAYTLAQLAAEYPALEGRSVVDVQALLSPAVGEAAAGAYEPPAPLRVVTTLIDPESAGDVTYEEISLSSARDDPNARLVFRLPAAVACAPGERTFRVFSRVEPARVCLFSRSAGCGWVPAGDTCADLESIFEHTFDTGVELRELPPKTLAASDGSLTCAGTSDVARGESRTWLCPGASGATFVALQDTATAKDGSPWVPSLTTRPALARRSLLARAPRGAMYASDEGSVNLTLARMEVKDSLQLDELVFLQDNQAPKLQVARSAIGELRRLTANAAIDTNEDQVVIDGDAGTVVLRGDHAVNASINNLAFYHPPVPIGTDVLPLARRRGDVISGPLDAVFALVDTGVMVLRASVDQVTKVGETPAGQVDLAGAGPLSFSAVKNGASERAIAWSADGHVWVFDGSGAALVSDCQLDGQLLAVIDGPRMVRRPPGERFVLDLVDLAPAENGAASCREERLVTRYLVPASDQDAEGELTVDASSHVAGDGRETLLYQYGAWAGVLDLGTGLSSAVELPIAQGTRAVLFEDYARTGLYAVLGAVDEPRFQGVAIPPLDPRAR